MNTKFMSTVRVNALTTHRILSSRSDGLLCVKQSIAAIITNKSGGDLSYATVLESGKAEVKQGSIPAGLSAVVQSSGELHVLSKDGKSTAEKLYDLANPMNKLTAYETAALRGLSVTSVEKLLDAIGQFGVDPTLVPWTYAQAKGRVIPFRCGLSFNMAKPWGKDGAMVDQVAEIDSAIVVNTISNEAYYIGRAELCSQWLIEQQPGLNATQFWNALPIISNDEFNAMMS